MSAFTGRAQREGTKFSTSGAFEGYVGAVLDMDKRKQAEHTLKVRLAKVKPLVAVSITGL